MTTPVTTPDKTDDDEVTNGKAAGFLVLGLAMTGFAVYYLMTRGTVTIPLITGPIFLLAGLLALGVNAGKRIVAREEAAAAASRAEG